MTDAPESPRRPREHATTPGRRDEIVRAALASFAEHGYERASLRDIAARAGLTHAALLRHFSGKDELLVAALVRIEADEEDLAARMARSALPAERILSAVLREEFRQPDYQRNWLLLSVAATADGHPAHDYFVQRRQRARTRFGDGVLVGPADTPLSADEKVTLMLAMIDGLRIQGLLDPDTDPLPLLDRFMRSLMAEGAEGADGTHGAGGADTAGTPS